MFGIIEGFAGSRRSLYSVANESPTFFWKRHLSINTELVLAVSASVAFPEADKHSPEAFRLISNLIYFANSYFDIGLPARQQLYKSKPFQFETLMSVTWETREKMLQSAKEVIEYFPASLDDINNFMRDGTLLAECKTKITGVEYRELDSAIAAALVFGLTGDRFEMRKMGIDLAKKCESEIDLKEKYKLFMVSKIDVSTLSEGQKRIVGQQAIEMVLACLDDQWGGSEDNLLKIPNTRQNGDEENRKLIDKYKQIAIKCDYSKLMVETLSLVSRVHQLKAKRQIGDPIDLIKIGKHPNFAEEYLLREWLNKHSVLSEMFR